MGHAEYAGFGKHVLGALYMELLLLRQVWKFRVVESLAVVLWAGYGPSWRLAFSVLLVCAFGQTSRDLLFSLWPAGGGRRGHLFAVFTLVTVGSGLLVGVTLLAGLAFNLLLSPIPEVRVGGIVLKYHPVSIRWLVLLLMASPMASLMAVWTYRNPIRQAMTIIAVLVAVMCLIWGTDVPWERLPLAGMIIAAAASWCLCGLGIYRIVMRSDLVER